MIVQMARTCLGLQRSQWLSKKQLEEIQLERVKAIVTHAYRKVPFYRNLYDAAHIDPTELREIGDIRKLPIATKQHFRSTPLEERRAVDANISEYRSDLTSGSTGIPITILDDPYYAMHQESLNLRFAWAIGVRPLDRVCRVSSILHPSFEEMGSWYGVKRRFYRHLNAIEPITNHVRFYRAWKPNVLSSGPWYYKILARFCRETGHNLNFDRAVTDGDILSDATRRTISDNLHADVYDIYGLNEVGSVAWECMVHAGYHINADSVLVEFLRNGEPVDPGEPGEVYVTSFCRTATPIIRYFTGDVGTPVGDGCPCGRGLPLMKQIQGRVIDFIQTEKGDVLSPYMVIQNLQSANGLEQFKVVQNRDYTIEVLVKLREECSDITLLDIENRCRKLFGQIPVNVMSVKQIENETGPKFRLVESRLTMN